MNNVNKIKMALLAMGVTMATMGSVSDVSAKDYTVNGQTGSTPVEIDIIEDTKDPIDPSIPGNPDPIPPTQQNLLLKHVPAKYGFNTTVQSKEYTISSTNIEEPTIDVFNDKSSREWSVKAGVEADKIMRGASDEFTLSSFTINKKELIGTGVDNIVAQQKDKTAINNTGLISTTVTDITIKFSDNANKLKVGDKLSGKINYQLYLVSGTN